MKKIRKIAKGFVVLGILLFTACDKEFEELNTNPNVFTTGEPDNLMAGAIKNTLDLVGGDMNFQMFLNYGSYIGQAGGAFPRFYYTEQQVNAWWKRFYVDILKNTQEVIDNNSERPGYANRVQIAKIWKSYVYSVMVSTFGGVPLSDAFSGQNSIAYDTEEEVYVAILALLKDAGESITADGDRLRLDPVFDGDNVLWKKFANTLRLKIALRISEGFPELAETHVREVMADESALISSGNEIVRMRWGTDEPNWSYTYRRFVFTNNTQQAAKINHYLMLFMKSYKDPRLEAFADPAEEPFYIIDSLYKTEGSSEKVAVTYGIPYLGVPLAGGQTLASWDIPDKEKTLKGYTDKNVSNIDFENFMTMDMDYVIISHAETNFMKAEAALKGWGGSKTADEYYYAGIDASFKQYGVSGAADYKNQDGIKWGTSSAGIRDFVGVVTSAISADPMEQIVRQRWLAMFFQGHDAWCLEKRTRLLGFPPHLNPEASLGLNYAVVPERMVYDALEVGLNGEAYAAAVARLEGGRNEMTTPLKMNKPYTPILWGEMVATNNYDFGAQWYGDSIDDLEAAGVDYDILK